MLPLIPLACIVAIVGGGAGLGWYFSQSEADREKADQYANRLAHQLYRTSLDRLTESQARYVASLVRQQFDS